MDFQALDSIEIKQIRYFLMAVENGNNFSRAAEQLHLDQPPFSQRIRSLEKGLGERNTEIRLFDRRHRPMHLTPAGQVFYEGARKALAQMQQAVDSARKAASGEIGQLTIGIASSAANGIISSLLRRYYEQYPNVKISLQELTAVEQIEALEAGQIDIGFEVVDSLLLTGRKLRSQVVTEESLVVVVPETHQFAKRKAVKLKELATEPLILPDIQAFPFYKAFLDCCKTAGFEPKLLENTKATWMLTILSLVAAGTGLAILPDNVLNLQRKGVVYKNILGLDLKRKLIAIWREDHRSETLLRLLSLLENA